MVKEKVIFSSRGPVLESLGLKHILPILGIWFNNVKILLQKYFLKLLSADEKIPVYRRPACIPAQCR